MSEAGKQRRTDHLCKDCGGRLWHCDTECFCYWCPRCDRKCPGGCGATAAVLAEAGLMHLQECASLLGIILARHPEAAAGLPARAVYEDALRFLSAQLGV